MAVVYGTVKRNLDTGAGANIVRTVSHTISGAANWTQIVAIGDADENNVGNLLKIDSAGGIQSSGTKASSVVVTEKAIPSNTDTTIASLSNSRLKIVARSLGETLHFGYETSAVSYGPFYVTEDYVEEMFKGDMWVRSTVATTVVIREYLE